MHTFETGRPAPERLEDVDGVLNFLWLELTNRCNLKCVHCYTESSPQTGDRDLLTAGDYETVMEQAHGLGCRQLQLIGGEPQLNRDFNTLLRRAVEIGFEFVEVFTNLTKLDDETIEFSADHDVRFATSVYSADPATHDAVTTVRGSHRRTIGNLKRLIDNGIRTRAGTLAINEDEKAAQRTRQFLVDLGVGGPIRSSEVRQFGRGQELLGEDASLSGLCGHCWTGKLAIAPDGQVFPCVMARDWVVGDVLTETLDEIVHGSRLAEIRREIHDTVWKRNTVTAACPECPQSCGPDLSCPCDPLLCPQSCEPQGCDPYIMCSPYIHVVEPE